MKNDENSWKNKLYFGDNFDILREHVSSESVDLIYLDPPFNSNATYNVLFGEQDGSRSQAQVMAFEDTWHWEKETAEATFHQIVREGSKQLVTLIQAFRSFLGENDMMAYLVMMAIRLAELHRVLKPTGALYLHCDPTASHYIKIILDAIFGTTNFRNEISWRRSGRRSSISKIFRRAHDVIFFVSKTDKYTFNLVYAEKDSTLLDKYSQCDDRGPYQLVPLMVSGTRGGETGKPWRGFDPNVRGKAGMHWITIHSKLEDYVNKGLVIFPQKSEGAPRLKYYLDQTKGVPASDFWGDIDVINSMADEALGYPTQKPEALLERIINASSNEGSLILDPFCGCGTAVNVAERLNRRWIGIDITHLAIALIRNRLHDTFGPELLPYKVIGDPKDLASARALADYDRYQFQWWAVGLVSARPAQDKKKGADSGIDGYIYFEDDNSGKAKQIVVQVKSGKVSVSQVRDLKGVMDREKATIGIFVSLEPFTDPMRKEAISAGYYDPEHLSPEHKAPRIQLFTIQDLLDGAEPKYPRLLTTTYKKAKRQFKDVQKQDSFV